MKREKNSSTFHSLSDEELHAMRGSKFAPLPTPPSRHPRLAHPAGPMTTNKAAALAKFLERKLQQPGGLTSIDPHLLELAVRNAKETVNASNGGASNTGRVICHVASFSDDSEDSGKDKEDGTQEREQKKKKKKKVVMNLGNLSTVKLKKKKK